MKTHFAPNRVDGVCGKAGYASVTMRWADATCEHCMSSDLWRWARNAETQRIQRENADARARTARRAAGDQLLALVSDAITAWVEGDLVSSKDVPTQADQ